MKPPRWTGDFTPLIPQGVQCYFGEEVERRRRVEAILAAILKAWGFQEIILPFFDYLEAFSYGLGSELGDRAYRFLDRDGSLLALRPDLTTLVAKTVATRMTAQPLPIKLFYSGEVFRHERAGAGKQKEYYQIGLESMGIGRTWADIEVLLMAIDCLRRIGVVDFKIALGHVGFFHGIVDRLGLSAEKGSALRDAVDRKDSAWIAEEAVSLDLTPEKRAFLIDLPNFAGGADVLERALAVVSNDRSRRALGELSEIHGVLKALGLDSLFTFDLSEVRGLDYYTGIVFKIYGRPDGRELGAGGRYDGLLGKFGWDLPAVGLQFTLDRVLPLVHDAAKLATPPVEGEEHVVVADDAAAAQLFGKVWALRSSNARVRLVGASC
jgi:ATP phosphoribosyltransferase regulatory subunit